MQRRRNESENESRETGIFLKVEREWGQDTLSAKPSDLCER